MRLGHTHVRTTIILRYFNFIQELARIGFTAEASHSYQIEPRGSGKACAISCTSGDYQTCVQVYNTWLANEISLYAFYQIREIDWCYVWGVSTSFH